MTFTIIVDGVDVTDKVRLDGWRIEMAANQGQVGTGRLIIDDTTGSADLAPTATEWSATESDATPTTIGGGFIGEQGIDRGPLVAGTQRQFGPVLEDWNAYLTDRVFKGSAANRPEETDYQRINWLVGQGVMSGIDGKGQVPNTNTVTMDPTNYRGKTPLDVLDDCAESAGKNFYIYYKSGTGWVLYYDKTGSTEAAFTSSLQLSGDLSDIDSSTVFGMSDVDYEIDPERIYSGLNVKWANGWVYEKNATTRSTYRNLQRTVIKENIKKASRARAWAQRQLSKLNEPTKRLECTVSVPGSALGELRPGFRIQVKLPKQGITGFTHFRIAQTTISPRKGRRGESDVIYDVRLKMFDKLRPVNLDDTYGGGDSSGNIGTGANVPPPSNGGTDGGGGGDSGDTTTPSGDANPVDDFERTSAPVVNSAAITDLQSTFADEITIDLPDGIAVGEVVAVIFVAVYTGSSIGTVYDWTGSGWADSGDSHGGTPTAVYSTNFRKITGSEGFTGSGDTIDLGTIATGVNHATVDQFWAYAVRVSGVSDLGSPDDDIGWNGAFTTGSPPLTLDPTDGWTNWTDFDDPALWFGVALSDEAISGSFTGYTEVFDDSQTGLPSSTEYHMKVATLATDSNEQNVDGVTYDGFANHLTAVFTLRGGGVLGWGSIPEGEGTDTEAPWEGGNAWSEVYSTSSNFSLDGSNGLFTGAADGDYGIMGLYSEAEDNGSSEPWGPWADGSMESLWRFKTNYVGSNVAVDPLRIELGMYTAAGSNTAIVHLGDGIDYGYMSSNTGIAIGTGTSSPSYAFAAKPIVADQYYFLRWDARGNTMTARLWSANDSEPPTWDVSLDKDYTSPGEYADYYVRPYANGGVVYSFDKWDSINGTTQSGPTSQILPPGNGASVTWYIEPWQPGTLRVWVDGIQTLPISVDISAGTFTFDRAPDIGAVIRVEYTPV